MAPGVDRELTELPVFDADASFPGSRPLGRVGVGRRQRGPARGVGFAVASLLLLTIGIAVGGMIETPGPSPSPSAIDPTPVATCGPVGTDRVPDVWLAVPGEDRVYRGRTGYTLRRGEEAGDRTWFVPDDAAPVEVASGTSLEVRTEASACMRYVIADVADVLEDDPPASRRQNLVNTAVRQTGSTAALGNLPDGEWVVRVTVYFETGLRGAAGRLIRDSYFRVRVGPGPFGAPGTSPTPVPAPTPAVTPAVACGPPPGSADVIELVAVTPADDAADLPGVPGVPAVAEVSEAEPIDVEIGDRVEIRVSGDVCATSWDIRVASAENIDDVETDTQLLNPDNDPAYAAQNRWQLAVPVGDFVLVADLQFGPTLAVHREWSVVGLEFTIPEAYLVGGDGSRVLLLPGCGATIRLANGYSATANCDTPRYPDGLEALHVPAWSAVNPEIPGWTITALDGSCGRLSGPEGSRAFEPANGCWLGYFGFGPDAGPRPEASPPPSVRFLARPGEQIVQLNVSASRDGNTFSVPMYGVVDGE